MLVVYSCVLEFIRPALVIRGQDHILLMSYGEWNQRPVAILVLYNNNPICSQLSSTKYGDTV